MRNTTLGRISAGFGFSVLLLLISAFAGYTSIRKLVESAGWVSHSHQVKLQADDITVSLLNGEAGSRGYAATGNPVFLDPYNNAHQKAIDGYSKAMELTADNPKQQRSFKALKTLTDRNFIIMQHYMQPGISHEEMTAWMMKGKLCMDSARQAAKNIKEEEDNLLAVRQAALTRYTAYTPILLLVASVLAVVITMVAFFRVRMDIRRNMQLQARLETEAANTRRRINIIGGIAGRISEGSYDIRVEDDEKDSLGSLADSLNQMAADLQANFNDLEDKEWLQRGMVLLNDQLKGDKDLTALCHDAIKMLITYAGASIGIMYLAENETLVPYASYALPLEPGKKLKYGEGLPGQTALNRQPMVITDVPAGYYHIKSGLGERLPDTLYILPMIYNGLVQGVIELATADGSNEIYSFLNNAADDIAVALSTTRSRLKLKELLEETQAQSEELHAQSEELQQANAELEIQAQRLQASEEELKVQQEELMQNNQELEEKAQQLEEKNQSIEEKTRELTELNSEVASKNRELELASRYKSEFLANMSHELRTPLNSIMLLSKLLSEENTGVAENDKLEYATVIHSAGAGLLELINEILDLSKIEAGQMNMDIEEVRLEDIHYDMDSLFRPLAGQKKVDYVIDFQAGLPVAVRSDKFRLEQVLKNLLSNAFKFTESGSVTLLVKPVSDEDKVPAGMAAGTGLISFIVKDTGIGIPAEKQGVIFEAFRQADGSTRRKYGGTGLGLSISRRIAQMLGGEISLESTPGQGSTFTAWLPVNAAVSEPALPAAPTEAGPPAPLSPVQPIKPAADLPVAHEIPDDRDNLGPEDKALLIIEDDVNFAAALLAYLHTRGYKGIVAVRGDDGVKYALKYRPSGILLDLQLPVMSGWEVMDVLKQNQATRHIPVHIMSSHEARRESLMRGAIDFISKPLAEEEISRMLEHLEQAMYKDSRKVLIIEDDRKHAEALKTYFDQMHIASTVAFNVAEGITMLGSEHSDCVILDISSGNETTYNVLNLLRGNKEYEKLPVIIYTGNSVSAADEKQIRKYANAIILKTASSYKRLLDEVSLFLHIMEDKGAQDRSRTMLKDQTLAGKTVIIADDDNRNLYSLSKALESQEMKVTTVSTGQEVLQKLKEGLKADIILMDMMMPELDGYDTIKTIRDMEQPLNSIPIIAVTAKAMPGDRAKCIQAGASDYISKPVDIDRLFSLLRVWLY